MEGRRGSAKEEDSEYVRSPEYEVMEMLLESVHLLWLSANRVSGNINLTGRNAAAYAWKRERYK